MAKKQKPKQARALAVIEAAPVSFFDWPGTIDRICARISAGGTLVDFCNEFNQRYQAVVGWIDESESRRNRYAGALAVRESHQKEIILRDLMELRALDIGMCCYDSGALMPLSEIPESARRWISRIETLDYYEGAGDHKIYIGEIKKIWLHDKLKAVDLMTKLLKMVAEKKENVGTKTLEDILAESRGDVESVEHTKITFGPKEESIDAKISKAKTVSGKKNQLR